MENGARVYSEAAWRDPKCWSGLLRSSLCIKKAVGDRSKVAKALKKLARANSAASFFRILFSTQVEFGMRAELLL